MPNRFSKSCAVMRYCCTCHMFKTHPDVRWARFGRTTSRLPRGSAPTRTTARRPQHPKKHGKKTRTQPPQAAQSRAIHSLY
jgi:hypothetical protein